MVEDSMNDRDECQSVIHESVRVENARLRSQIHKD